MSAEFFLDTNVIVYAFDQSAPQKREKARSLVFGDRWITSWQVVQEFANVALHRFKVPMLPRDLSEYLEVVMWPHCQLFPSQEIYRKALEIHRDLQYRFYDSLIVSAALASGAKILYSEDLQHGRTLGSLRIENPF